MPRGLPNTVKVSLNKAIDSALLAIETYNKPAVKFKSGGYIVLMIIAWTSLFHSIFFRKKIKPFYKDKTKKNRYEKRDGDYVYWELSKCIKEYFKGDTNNPIRKNLEFFIPLRNMIEHKSLPEIDANIFAECQALILNFDKILEKEFGDKYCIRESLSFALQLFPSSKSLKTAVTANKEAKKVVQFINSYRSTISTDILESGEYSFKAFLIQVSNHNSKDSLPIQFIRYDKLSEQEKKNINRVAALIKNKLIPVSNLDLLKPGTVVNKVQSSLGNPKIIKNGKQKDKFNMDVHTRCWKKYKVRPSNGSSQPEQTKPEYCIYDKPNKSYLYTEKWVEFLVEKMSDENEYNSLYEKE
ncbi:MAG TPA: DUF3644 domain-containing protein [Bacilli bacterium]|nr:DUF3644 domain-containing protein [Bacilli bacterium]